MKKIIIIAASLALILLVAVGVFVATSGDDKSEETSEAKKSSSVQTKTKEDNKSNQSNNEISFAGLVSEKDPRQCEMTYSSDQGSGEGTVYVDGNGNGRFEFKISTDRGNEGTQTQIVKGDTAYSWFETGGQKIGFKTTIDKLSAGSITGSGDSSDAQGDFKFDCEKWNPDSAKFEIPTDVVFQNNPLAP